MVMQFDITVERAGSILPLPWAVQSTGATLQGASFIWLHRGPLALLLGHGRQLGQRAGQV